jgi:glucuronate isomerase
MIVDVKAKQTSFLDDNFLLKNDFARLLYHDYARKLPIIDYHCHLPPKDIAEDRQFENITKIWLEGDHYKWRAMRTLGIGEEFITGNRTDKEKFQTWAYTVPYTMRNPLYHWTHLELQRHYGIVQLLNETSADSIYHESTEQLQGKDFSARGIISKMNVETICTTDDPTDTLEYHKKIKSNNFKISVRPTFRPDKAYAVESFDYGVYLKKLSEVSGLEVVSFSTMLDALHKRIQIFHDHGCRLSDHGLEQLYYPTAGKPFDINQIFEKVLRSVSLATDEVQYFKYCTLIELGRLYHKMGWVQQYHLGAIRNTNDRMMRAIGPDTGFDSIGDFTQAKALSKFLNELDSTNQLAKTIIYNLNPADNEVMATMIGNFNDGSIKGKIQFGSAWWFLDQKDGIEKQINTLSNLGLLSSFIGMLTDSRSFMSYPRHEYFRRILCNMIGRDVEQSELPWDEKWLGKIVSDICYFNTKEYFKFESI